MDNSYKGKLVTAGVAGAVASLIYKLGVPTNLEQLTVFMVLAAFGMLAWMIQNADARAVEDRASIVHTQEKISLVMENHLSVVEKSLAIFPKP